MSASSKPPVTATPLIAPISGLRTLGNGPRTPWLRAAVGAAAAAEVAGRRAELLEVEAGAERRVGTGEDDDVDLGVAVGLHA